MVKTRSVNLESGESVLMKITSRNIVIISSVTALEIIDDEKHLIALEYSKDLKFAKDKTIVIDKQPYKIIEIKEKISNGTDKSYILNIHKLTKSSMFIMPFLGHDREYFKWKSIFCNCFIGTESCASYGDSIFLLYRFSGQPWFSEFEAQLKSNPHFIESVDVDKAHVLYEFSVPSEYEEDKNLILEGKYSEVSEGAKTRIISFHKSGKGKPLYQILHKSEIRRKEMEKELGDSIPKENELFDKFKESNEIYLNKYRVDEQQKKDYKRF